MIDEIEIFSPEECQRIRDTIHKLRTFWTHRDSRYKQPFFTLGAASYLDARPDPALYYEKARKNNIVLKSQFQWVYDKLQLALSQALAADCVYDEGIALPGYHIFLASKVFERPVASLHCDLQYELLNWEGKNVSFDDPISFTASIRLPVWGGGLTVWDLRSKDTEGLSNEERSEVIKKTESHFHKYRVGHMTIHSGQRYHQIAPMQDVVEGDERITLQGHGLRSENGYILYW